MTRRTPRAPIGAAPTWLAHLPASVVFFDVETIGVYAGSDRIVTIAGIGLETEALARDEFDFNYLHLAFNPGRRNDPEAERIHGYSDARLRLLEPFSARAEDIRRFLSSYDLLVAHNASFDLGFVNHEMRLAGLTPLSRPVYCTMRGYRALGHEGSARLDAVCERINLSRSGEAHGALEDAWLTMCVYLWLNGCPIQLDLPHSAPLAPTNMHEAPPVLERPPQLTLPEEIRIPRRTRRPRPPVATPTLTTPIRSNHEIRSEDTRQPTEEVPVPQPPSRPIVRPSLAENPQPPSPQPSLIHKPSLIHTYPAPLEEKTGGLFSVVWMFALFLFFAGMPVFLILTYVFNHDLPPLMALPKLIAALLLNFSAFAGANLARTPVYSKSTISHQIGWALSLVAVPATFVAIYLFIHNSGWAYGLMLWYGSGGLSFVLLTALRKGLRMEGLGTLLGIVAGIVGFVLFVHSIM